MSDIGRDAQEIATGIPAPSQRQVVMATLSSIFGWGLDLFDLFILLYIAPIVGHLFFPVGSPMLSLAATYASFAVTLLVRPLGSALFGSYADRHGRRRAMLVAVVGVGVATAIFGALPTVQQIGWSAAALFLFFRLVQGVFVGGVVASSHTIGTESVAERWRGLMSGSVGGAGAAMGGLLASFIFFIVSILAPGPEMAAWGWRLMFFSGLLTSVVGVILFRHLEESPFFQAQAAKKAARRRETESVDPLKLLMRPPYRNRFLINLLITFGSGAGYYLTSGYLPAFFSVVNHLPHKETSLILIIASLGAAAGAMSCGALSQVIGRKTVFLIACVVRIVAFPLLYLAMAHAHGFGTLTLYAVLMAFIANGSYGPVLIFLNERFPTSLRATGTGLSWNIGFALGGMMPTVVSLVAAGHGGSLAHILAVFTVATSVVFLVGALLIPETKGALEAEYGR